MLRCAQHDGVITHTTSPECHPERSEGSVSMRVEMPVYEGDDYCAVVGVELGDLGSIAGRTLAPIHLANAATQLPYGSGEMKGEGSHLHFKGLRERHVGVTLVVARNICNEWLIRVRLVEEQIFLFKIRSW